MNMRNHRISAPATRFLRNPELLTTAVAAAMAFAPSFAQAPPDNVHWNAAVAAGSPARPGGELTIALNGSIDEGWHVYGLKQLPDGPTALRVKLDDNTVAAVAGEITESKPETIHDARFGVDTHFHTHSVSVQLPIRVLPGTTGPQQIPVSVRFQLCSEGECQPPRTVHLAVPVEVH